MLLQKNETFLENMMNFEINSVVLLKTGLIVLSIMKSISELKWGKNLIKEK